MTGYENVKDAQQAMELGALCYLTKPIRHQTLMGHVQRAVIQIEQKKLQDSYRLTLENTIQERTNELSELLRVSENQNRRLDSIINNLREGLIVLNTNGTILQTNTTIVKIFQLPKKSILGMSFTDVLPVAFVIPLKFLMHIAAMHGDEFENDVRSIRMGENYFTLSFSSIRNVDGSSGGYICTVFDETEKIKNEQLRAGFLNLVAHEFRTPLQVIMSSCSTFEYEKNEEQVKCLINTTKQATKHLSDLVTSVLRIASVSQSKMSIDFSPIDCVYVVENQLSKIQRRYVWKRQIIHKQYQKEKCIIKSNADLLGNAVEAILDNAFKFTNENGTLHINIETDTDVVITISDNGGGIPQEKCYHIFEWFHQAEDALTRTQGGLGLGLPLAKQAIELITGFITFESVFGKGTSFKIHLPLINPS